MSVSKDKALYGKSAPPARCAVVLAEGSWTALLRIPVAQTLGLLLSTFSLEPRILLQPSSLRGPTRPRAAADWCP